MDSKHTTCTITVYPSDRAVLEKWLDDEIRENSRLHGELNRSFCKAGFFWFPLGWIFGALIQSVWPW